jgi:hypothetical protein
VAIEDQILYRGEIKITHPDELFSEFNVTDKDLKRYEKLVKQGKAEQAIDEFIEKYMVDVVQLYNATIQRYMEYAEEGQMKRSDLNQIITSTVLLSDGLSRNLNKNFKVFATGIVAVAIFIQMGIKSRAVKNAILDATVNEFITKTAGAMAETQQHILTGIREMQQAMVIQNQKIRQMPSIDELINKEIAQFRENLRRQFPEYYRSMEDGALLKSRRFTSAGKLKSYKLEDYTEMSARTTILNVDRTSVEVVAKIEGIKVVEYYLRDNRKLKTGFEREICKSILGKTILGKSLLAMDQATANNLGIRTIEHARSDGAMGPWCRHSIRFVSNTFKNKVNKMLKVA